MSKHFRFSIYALLTFFPVVLYAAGDDVSFPTDTLSILTSVGNVVMLSVEVATTEPQLEHGLMFRKELARDHGMIFLLGKPQPVRMWMKNTPIPLDMLFMDNKGIVLQIVRNTKPESTDIIASASGNVTAVLELSDGVADYYHIATGDNVIYSAFK